MGSIWTGLSGLTSYSDAIGVVANNLANTNTTGFKSSRVLFADLISSAVGSTTDGSQVGNGSTLGSVSMAVGMPSRRKRLSTCRVSGAWARASTRSGPKVSALAATAWDTVERKLFSRYSRRSEVTPRVFRAENAP